MPRASRDPSARGEKDERGLGMVRMKRASPPEMSMLYRDVSVFLASFLPLEKMTDRPSAIHAKDFSFPETVSCRRLSVLRP